MYQDDGTMDPVGPDDVPPPRYSRPPQREPMFNLPTFVAGFAALLFVIHVLGLLLTEEMQTEVMLLFAFIPARYGELAPQIPWPSAAVWSPITYSLLHGSWTHLLMNLFWFVAFASPVGRRLGTLRSLGIAIITSLGGALAHAIAFSGEFVPMIGASAVVAGFMGAAARFAFLPTRGRGLNVDGPALSLVQAFTNPRFLIFVGVWAAINYLFGTGAVPIAGEGVAIAWQAHMGGFLAGVLAFSFFDRTPVRTF